MRFRNLAISGSPKGRKCLISQSFLGKVSVRPVPVGAVDVNSFLSELSWLLRMPDVDRILPLGRVAKVRQGPRTVCEQAQNRPLPRVTATVKLSTRGLSVEGALISSIVKSMGEYGKNTHVIITTDHGRGANIFTWQHHHAGLPSSRYIWAYIWNADGVVDIPISLDALGNRKFGHIDLRGYIEKLML